MFFIINDASKRIAKLSVDEEKNNIILSRGFFNSPHEFYGVLQEELEEAIETHFECMYKMDNLWFAIKKDRFDLIKLISDEIYQIAFSNILEWVQVCAVIEKYREGCSNDKD